MGFLAGRWLFRSFRRSRNRRRRIAIRCFLVRIRTWTVSGLRESSPYLSSLGIGNGRVPDGEVEAWADVAVVGLDGGSEECEDEDKGKEKASDGRKHSCVVVGVEVSC